MEFSCKEDIGTADNSIPIGHIGQSSVTRDNKELSFASHLSHWSWLFCARLALALRCVSSGNHVHSLFSSCARLTPASDIFWLERTHALSEHSAWPGPLLLVIASSYLRSKTEPGGRYISYPNALRLCMNIASGKVEACISHEVSRKTQEKVHKIIKEGLGEFNDSSPDNSAERQLVDVLKSIDNVLQSEAILYD